MKKKKKSYALLKNINLSKEVISHVSPQESRHMWILIRAEWLITELVLSSGLCSSPAGRPPP